MGALIVGVRQNIKVDMKEKRKDEEEIIMIKLWKGEWWRVIEVYGCFLTTTQ